MGETENQILLKKGAEASLFLADWHERKVVLKRRLPKKYRQPELDERIRSYRTIHEPQLMHEAKKAGVNTPLVLLVDVKKAEIVMEYIKGNRVKELLGNASAEERQGLCARIGKAVGKLHHLGIIHGDLTTSNMIVDPDGDLYFVDFGLGERNVETETRAVDLHLMKRALQSTHFLIADDCFNAVIEGYSETLGLEYVKTVLAKMADIERRGRYIADRKA